MIPGPALECEVFSYWGQRFHCPSEDLARTGSLLLPDEEFRETGNVHIYHVGRRSLVRLDPDIATSLQMTAGQVLASAISRADLETIVKLGMKHIARVSVAGNGSYFYLDPLNFQPYRKIEPLILRKINPEMDQGLIAGLCQSCTPEEVEAAEIFAEQPDEVIFGHLLDGKLVSYAGFRTWEGRFADIGVLTHPLQRGLGLALAGASRLCAWCLENELIPMYRVDDANRASLSIPTALGFTKMVDIEILKVEM